MNYKELYLNEKKYQRVNRKTAKELHSKGVALLVYAVNANPSSPWIGAYRLEAGNNFDSSVNAFEYYNCNNELGNYAKFYKEV